MTFAEPQTAAELRAHYRAVRLRIWGAKPAPQAYIPPPAPPPPTIEETIAAVEAEAPPVVNTRHTSADVVHAVATVVGITPQDMASIRRFPRCNFARHIAFYICREEFGWSYPRIGRIFSRDHSTILHGINKVKDALAANHEKYVTAIAEAHAILESK